MFTYPVEDFVLKVLIVRDVSVKYDVTVFFVKFAEEYWWREVVKGCSSEGSREGSSEGSREGSREVVGCIVGCVVECSSEGSREVVGR